MRDIVVPTLSQRYSQSFVLFAVGNCDDPTLDEQGMERKILRKAFSITDWLVLLVFGTLVVFIVLTSYGDEVGAFNLLNKQEYE